MEATTTIGDGGMEGLIGTAARMENSEDATIWGTGHGTGTIHGTGTMYGAGIGTTDGSEVTDASVNGSTDGQRTANTISPGLQSTSTAMSARSPAVLPKEGLATAAQTLLSNSEQPRRDDQMLVVDFDEQESRIRQTRDPLLESQAAKIGMAPLPLSTFLQKKQESGKKNNAANSRQRPRKKGDTNKNNKVTSRCSGKGVPILSVKWLNAQHRLFNGEELRRVVALGGEKEGEYVKRVVVAHIMTWCPYVCVQVVSAT